MPLKTSFIISILLSGLLWGEGFELKPGKTVPSLLLPSAREHQPVRTDSFLGKKTMIHVFASW